MATDAQDAAIPRGRNSNGQGLLQVVLLSYDDNGERNKEGDRYAAIGFPQSYEDAMASIQQNLGQYLLGGPARIDSIDLLCPMLNINDEWIWAEANKKDWNLIVEELARSRKILAIRQRKMSSLYAEPDNLTDFIRGPVILSYGETKGGRTTWTSVPMQSREFNLKGREHINRPASYKDAVEIIVQSAKTIPQNQYNDLYNAIIKVNGDVSQFQFKFCSFVTKKNGVPSINAWKDFPDEAYTDDWLWREVVPEVYQILGYTLHPKV